MSSRVRPFTLRSVALTAAALGLAVACAGGGGSAKSTSSASGDTTSERATSPSGASAGTRGGAAASEATKAGFDASDFGAPGKPTNTWLPFAPGTRWVRDGTTDVGHRRLPHRVVSTVTGVTKEIDGVRTIAVLDQDIDAGQVSQESLDYFAEDGQGNVWYLGSYTEEYEGGNFVAVLDAWLAGVKGGEPGILVQADPRTGTAPYSIARPPGEVAEVAQVVKTGQRTCVPFKCFNDVLVIREGKASARDSELKYYAPGVGQVLNTPRAGNQNRDVEKLVNLTMLSGQGLDEANAEAIKLDRHARSQEPKVFGPSAAAVRL